MPVVRNVHISRHAIERCRERLYEGINAATVAAILKGKYIRTADANSIGDASYFYEHGGCRFVLKRRYGKGIDTFTLVTVYWINEKE